MRLAGGLAAGNEPPASARWEVDLLPVPISLGDDPDARPAAVLIVADDQVLHVDLESRPPAEPGEIAILLADAVRLTAERVGAAPEEIRVRHRSVADALGAVALPGGPRVVRAATPELDRAARSLLTSVADSPAERPLSAAVRHTWSAWGLDREVVADLFHAAATFYRAAPWRGLEADDLLRLETAAGGKGHVLVMGAGGEEFGLALYEKAADHRRLLETPDPSVAFGSLQGGVVAVTLDRANDLPREMRKEILSAGWEIAAPDAYPVLMTMNTPAGLITRGQAADVAAALRGAAGFAGQFRSRLRAGEAGRMRWRDPETGATLSLTRAASPAWVVRPAELTPALPRGPGARPEAAPMGDHEALRLEGQPLLDRFRRDLEGAGLGAATVGRHVSNAELLIDYLAGAGISLAAMTEYDLRIFLHDWFPRKVIGPAAEIRSMPVSLKRFVGLVEAEAGVTYPWAGPILGDRERFEERLATFPGGFFFDPAVAAWRMVVTMDLAMRGLLPDSGMAGGADWGDTMGATEFQLHHELQRRWLVWRDEVIGEGVVEPDLVRKALVRRQREWEERPHPDHGRATPVEAVRRERERRPS